MSAEEPEQGRSVLGVLLEPIVGWAEEGDLRIVFVTIAFVYGLFALLVIAQAGLGYGTINQIAGAWRGITFFFAAYAILALALNLHWGYTGMFNIGIAGFMAVGVYTMALLSGAPEPISPGQGHGLGLPLPIGVLGGMLAAGLVGLVAAVPALRLRADYLAIVTLALSEIIRLLAQSRDISTWTDGNLGFATGGGRGFSNLPDRPTDQLFDPSDLVVTIAGEEVMLISGSILRRFIWALFMLAFMIGIYWLLRRISSSPFGRVLKAIREDELVAQSLGKDTRWFKIKVFMLGCALMGLGGILWQGSQGVVSPDSFRPIVTFYVFIALIIGGAGSNTGSVVGSILFAGLLFQAPRQVGAIARTRLNLTDPPGTFYGALEGLASLDVRPLIAYTESNLAPLQFVLLGVVLVVIVQKRPNGVLGHRTEIAAAVDLSERSGPGDGTAAGTVGQPDERSGGAE